MKKSRQDAILKIVRENIVATQDDLISLLQSAGFNVTQATISRDIKELGLAKAVDGTGVQRYIVHSVKKVKTGSHDYIFSSSVISVATAVNDIVIKCYPGMANAACAVLDNMEFPEVLGTLAGDDTILVIAKSEKDAQILYNKINSLK
ncbi:MAG: arginine repressor [Clostridia bacterium]|nr:arginine repressor [Clostridia bacterium]